MQDVPASPEGHPQDESGLGAGHRLPPLVAGGAARLRGEGGQSKASHYWPQIVSRE